MKVAYLLKGSYVSGGQRVVYEHVTRLNKRGHDAGIVLLDGASEFWLAHAPPWGGNLEVAPDDWVIATSWQTAEWLHQQQVPCRKGYFVQMRESCMVDNMAHP